MNDLPAPTSRARHGRWLGGVCAGLAARWDVPPARVRLAFVLGALALGLGVLAYLAAWLILPAESEDGATAGQRGHRPAGSGLRGAARPRDAGRRRRGRDRLRLRLGGRGARRRGARGHARGLGPARARLGAAADRSPCPAVGRHGRRRAARRAELDVRRSDPTHARRAAARPSDQRSRPAHPRSAADRPARVRADSAADRGGRAAHADRAPARPLRARDRQPARPAVGAGLAPLAGGRARHSGSRRRSSASGGRPDFATPRRARARRSRSTSPRWAASSSCATIRTTSTRPSSPTGPGYPVYRRGTAGHHRPAAQGGGADGARLARSA